MISGAKLGARLDRWLDEWRMAFSGVILATRSRKFLLAFGLSFVVFGTLMNLLASSTAALSLFWATDLSGKLAIIRDSFFAIFGVGRNFWDWLLLFAITLLQSVLIGLVVFVWHTKHRSRRDRIESGLQNSDNIQSAGLVAGLAVLGSGCPTCGTTLLMPVLGTIFSSSGYIVASAVSGLLTAAAIVLALLSLKRIGRDAYVVILAEEHRKHHRPDPEPKE